MDQFIVLASICIFFAICAVWLSSRLKQRSGVPAGSVVYDDAGSWYKVVKPLFNRRLMLTGKPDYVIRHEDGSLIPVEYKSAAAPKRPYESHIMQLAAYCALVEDHYGQRPTYGVIRYSNKSFEVDYTPQLEKELISILEDMRLDMADNDVPRSHDQWQRCKGCGFGEVCSDSLVLH